MKNSLRTIFTSKQIYSIDSIAAAYLNLSSFELMQKAGMAIYSYVQHYSNILVVAGAGNNAGDGFIIAQLALEKNQKVVVLCLVNVNNLPIDAKNAAENYLGSGGEITYEMPCAKFDCIVDAIFGTGINRAVEGKFAIAIKWINSQNSSIISVDVPSGLNTDTGTIHGYAVKATITVCVIGYKPGLITNNGKDQCGKLFLEDLDVPNCQFNSINSQIKLLDKTVLNNKHFLHHHNSHKGSFGKMMVVGGHDGMLGALILAGKSALNSGCGMVEVVSNNEHSVMVSVQCPELITASSIKTARFIEITDVIAIGPGLGLNQQSKDVLNYCLEQNKPMVIDADAITLVANKNIKLKNTVLTPHPKEAASLLNTDINSIQLDRISAALEISQKYKSTVILKGSGTVIAHTNGDVYICPFGYSGMATAGMGDVLTGIVAGLMAQGFTTIQAATTAVVWHSVAAENCNKGNFLIATDVIKNLHKAIK